MIRKLLVAEDQRKWQRGLRAMLPVSRYDLCILASGTLEAPDYLDKVRESLKQGDFDLAIVNINLLNDPDILDEVGVDLLELILSEHSSLPRIVMTGKGRADTIDLRTVGCR